MADALNYWREIQRLKKEMERPLSFPTAASWLQSDFEAPIWEGSFDGYHKITVNFSVLLDDGSLLTDGKNADFLLLIKAWLCSQGKPNPRIGVAPSASHLYSRVRKCFTLIDYFLLRASYFQLGRQGLSLITANDISALFDCLVESNKVALTVYEWPERLRAFLEENSVDVDVTEIIKAAPIIAEPVQPLDSFFGVSDREKLLRYRAYLWANGYYTEGDKSTVRDSRQFLLATKRIAKKLYRNTLRGCSYKPAPAELELGTCRTFFRELPSVPVKDTRLAPMQRRELESYSSVLNCLAPIEGISKNLSVHVASSTAQICGKIKAKTRSLDRYATLPPQVVLKCLRDAIEFYLLYGEGLVTSYLNIAGFLERKKDRRPVGPVPLKGQALESLLCPSLKSLPIQWWVVWGSSKPGHGEENNTFADPADFFQAIRRGNSLWHLLMVLFGCVLITLGTLMARRVSELINLQADSCLDSSSRHLLFHNAKSGLFGMRQREARPIPPIAVQMIGTLKRLQWGLIELGVIDSYTSLFARPNHNRIGLTCNRMQSTDKVLNIFCDYFQVPENGCGQRYYIRIHQLRRFFAMAFFWSGTAAGPETLRWFLAHTDVEHLYHYITESTPGKVLRSVKANFAGELVKKSSSSAEALSDLLEQHFGIRDFCLLSSFELEEYIGDLLDEGTLVIEPEFFEGPKGKQYKILVKVQ